MLKLLDEELEDEEFQMGAPKKKMNTWEGELSVD